MLNILKYNVVIAKELVKKYGERVAVKGVSFTVAEGEIFGLIGPNGAGKTTTLRMIATLVKPDSGEIFIKNIDAVKEPVKARKYIGYLPEEAEVYSRLTGYEHLLFYAKLRKPDSIEEAVEFGIKLSGLGKRIYDRAGDYSKGMKRRLLLAIALMTKPDLAILDEPTSGLDVYASVHVRKMIRDYVRETGSAIILSSHNMLEVEYLCDRIAFISRGRIVSIGNPREILDKYGVANLEEAFVKAVEEAEHKYEGT